MNLWKTRPLQFMILSIGLSFVITGCGVLQGLGQTLGNSAGDESSYTEQEQALESDEWEDFEGIDLSGDDDSDEGIPSEPMPDNQCPKPGTSIDGYIEIEHTWDWSLNREVEKMKIDGKTEADSLCPITISSNTMFAQYCLVPITNTGFIKTEKGVKCGVNSSGWAVVKFEDGICDNGIVHVTILESMEAENANTGSMICPGYTAPYGVYFPFTRTDVEFGLNTSGVVHFTEEANPDPTETFKYEKSWTLFLKCFFELLT